MLSSPINWPPLGFLPVLGCENLVPPWMPEHITLPVFQWQAAVINNRRWVWFNAVAVYKWNFLVARQPVRMPGGIRHQVQGCAAGVLAGWRIQDLATEVTFAGVREHWICELLEI